MPRDFDSDDRTAGLSFTENVECPECEEIFPGQFFDSARSLSVQDMRERLSATHECPECGTSWVSEMTGWMMFGEAG